MGHNIFTPALKHAESCLVVYNIKNLRTRKGEEKNLQVYVKYKYIYIYISDCILQLTLLINLFTSDMNKLVGHFLGYIGTIIGVQSS